MRFLVISAIKDLKRRLADPLALLIWIGFPALLGVLISLLAGDNGTIPTARVLLVNQDDSAITGLLAGALEQTGDGEGVLLRVEEVDLEEGRQRIGDGDATALLIVPPGFGDALLADEPTELTLVTNPAEQILPAIVVEELEILRDAVFYGQRIVGEPIREIAAGPPPGRNFFDNAVIARLAVQINDRLADAENLLDPPILELNIGAEEIEGTLEKAAAGFDLARFIMPGMIFMSILFIAQGMSEDLWREKDGGTLRRAVTSPHSLLPFIVGKLIAGLLLTAAVSTVALLVAVWAFDLPMARIPVAIIWCTFAGTALLGFFHFIAILGNSQRSANIVTSMVLFPLMMIGGSFFPFEAMPAWMRGIGVWTPNGMAVVQLREMLFGVPELPGLAVAALGIAAITGISLFLCLRRLRVLVTV
jgi:ABC-type multidrug transport system permease subunit